MALSAHWMGVASVTNSIGHTVEEVAEIRAAWAQGQAAADEVRLAREAAEQKLLLNRTKVERGDNVQLYYAGALVAVMALWLLR